MNNNIPYWEEKARELDKSNQQDKARWYRIRRPTAPGSTPYGMARPIKDIQLDQQDPLALNEARSGQATAPNPYGKFGTALMDLLKRHQALGTKAYQQGALSLEEQQTERVMKQAEPGMPPSLQSQIRGAEAGALQPSISGVRERGRTFAEQLSGFSGALAQSQQIGEFMANQERQTELMKKQDEKEARDIIFQFPGAVMKLPEEQKRALEKQAGLNTGLIDLLSVQTEPETRTLGEGLFERGENGKWTMVARAPADISAGIDTEEGIDELDPTSQSILAQTGLSIPAYSFLTTGVKALTRMKASDRKRFMEEAEQWSINNNVDISTFQSEFQAYNEVVKRNIKISALVGLSGADMKTSLDMLENITKEDYGDLRIKNVVKLWAGKEVNDPLAMEYMFNLNDLRSALSGFFAVQQGRTMTLDSDKEDAEDLIKTGLATGSISGMIRTVDKVVERTVDIADQSVILAQDAIWKMFGVSKPGGSQQGAEDLRGQLRSGEMLVKQRSTGTVGAIPEEEYDEDFYEEL